MSDTETTDRFKLDAVETERIIRDLVRQGEINLEHIEIVPEHFDRKITSKSYHYCALCGRTLSPNERIDNHLSGKKTHNLNMQSPKAMALLNFSKGMMEKIKSAHINLDLIPDPETEDGQRIHRAYQRQLRNFGVPMSGKKKEPVPSSASIARTAESISKPIERMMQSAPAVRAERQRRLPYCFSRDYEMGKEVHLDDAKLTSDELLLDDPTLPHINSDQTQLRNISMRKTCEKHKSECETHNLDDFLEEHIMTEGTADMKLPVSNVFQKMKIEIKDEPAENCHPNETETAMMPFSTTLDIPFFTEDEVSVCMIGHRIIVKCQREVSALGLIGGFLSYSIDLHESANISTVETIWNDGRLIITAQRSYLTD